MTDSPFMLIATIEKSGSTARFFEDADAIVARRKELKS